VLGIKKPYARGFETMGSKTKLLGIKNLIMLRIKSPLLGINQKPYAKGF
jgi:hypothetical protein